MNNNLTKDQQFGLLLAAFGHDLNHSGQNNNFEISAITRLALKYSDKSPLEYNHIYILYKILSNPEVNLLDKMDPEERV